MIELREAVTDEHLEATRAVRLAVHPNERAATVEEIRASWEEDRLMLLAFLDGKLAGSGIAGRSSIPGRVFVAPRVLPDRRGRGVGTAVLRRLADHGATHGFPTAVASVAGADEHSVAFACKFGFEQVDRQVEQVLEVDGNPPTPRLVDGVAFVSIAERPELLREAFALGEEGFADMPVHGGVTVTLDEWLRDEATLPAGSFVALADGEIVGYAGLLHWQNEPTKAEHGLTVVRRDWRGRGLATALKQREITWAAGNGLRELVTWTQTGNENMQRVNERLGYVTRGVALTFVHGLPL
jgi:mycothiol synthase